MRLYATVSSDRGGREAKKGGDKCVHIELEAFGIPLGEVVMEVLEDTDGKQKQYLLSYLPSNEDDESIIIEEGHKDEGVIQRAR